MTTVTFDQSGPYEAELALLGKLLDAQFHSGSGPRNLRAPSDDGHVLDGFFL
jgi:hypothetical protein